MDDDVIEMMAKNPDPFKQRLFNTNEKNVWLATVTENRDEYSIVWREEESLVVILAFAETNRFRF